MRKVPRLLPLIAVAIGGVVVLRAVGIAPGLFDGAKAWAEEAAPATAPKPAAAVCAVTPEQLAQQAGLSPAEMRILQSLSKRRGELDARDTDLASMLPLMATAEQKLDAKVQALNAIKAEVQGLLGQVDDKEKAEMDRLVQVYSAMRPREAARVFATLDDSVRLPVAAAMRPRSLAAIMAQMDPAAARVLTERLAGRFAAQQKLAARAAAAASIAPEPAPAAAPTEAAPAAPTPVAAPPAATRSATRPATRRPQSRPAAPRSVTPPPVTPPAKAEPAGERPYQAGATPPAPNASRPRQSVQ